MPELAVEPGSRDVTKIEEQYQILPPKWRRFDRAIIWATECSLFVVGSLFVAMVSLEVASRYLFNFSILFVNAAARMLLVWFFLLGAGLALRIGAHVGIEVLLTRLAPRHKRIVLRIAQSLAIIFFIQMVWSGLYALGPALHQTELGLDIPLFWGFLAIPVGFASLIYHMLVLILVDWRRAMMGEVSP